MACAGGSAHILRAKNASFNSATRALSRERQPDSSSRETSLIGTTIDAVAVLGAADCLAPWGPFFAAALVVDMAAISKERSERR